MTNTQYIETQPTSRQLAVLKRNEATSRKYAEAVRLYAETDMTMKDIATQCGLTRGALCQYIRRNERKLMLRRHNMATDIEDLVDVKIIQSGQESAKAHEKYKEAVEACKSMDYIGLNVSQIAKMFGVKPTGLANFMRIHFPDVIPDRELIRQQQGLADNTHRGMSTSAKTQYAEAVELYRTTDMTMPQIAKHCKVSEHGLSQHLRFYHKDILLEKRLKRKQAKEAEKKRKGDLLGNGRANRPLPKVVMKYAAALALYKSTDMTMKDIVAKTGVPAQGFRFYLHKWHKELVLERSGIKAGEFDKVNITRERTRMKTVTAKYAEAIESLRRKPRPMTVVAREFGHNPDTFRQYLHKYEPELVVKKRKRKKRT